DKEILFVEGIYNQIQEEFESPDSSQEEMIRTYLKQLIIKATRIWKIQQLGVLNDEPTKEMDFFRDFSRLVEIHFRTKHTVADYADILGVAPKTLSNKFNRLELTQPNDIIKDRIILEAKRFLGHSSLSIKEIAYQLGYEDPAYFNRLFTNKVGDTPSNFRRKYLQGKNVQLE
ncbi:MAG: AraC family transcriptional regulator, partial [Flavobacterium sp.]